MKFLILCTFVFSTTAQAFINIESLRQKDGRGLLGSASVNLSGQQGNTNNSTTALTSLTIYRWQRDELLFLANYKYGTRADISDANNGQAHLRYTFMDREPHAIEMFTQGEYDQFKNLQSRTLVGASLRERILKDENSSFHVGIGAMYEMQRYTGGLERQGARGNIYLAYALQVEKRYAASSTLYYQPLLSSTEDFRVRFQVDVDVSLSTYTALNLQYQLSHDSWVPPGIKPTDSSYLTGIKVTYQ